MTLTTNMNDITRDNRPIFDVLHPLDDEPEKKVDTEHLGPMRMTFTVRLCLYALRGYLLLMFGLLGFRVLQLAGMLQP
jgi:hypothetical protein